MYCGCIVECILNETFILEIKFKPLNSLQILING